MPTKQDIASWRLRQHRIVAPTFEQPAEVVEWFGAVQAQDYPGALWAVGLRMRQATEATIQQALADRKIVRTWPMRGTLHFVAAADVRWMLELMTPRILAVHSRRLEQHYGLDEATFARSREVLGSALQGGKQLSRNALYQTLEAAQIATANQRGLQIIWRLAQEGLICLGAREGKQPTFTLLKEWVPNAKSRERDDALAELARRYFTGHGPATLQDFIWWSGLTAAEARTGLESVRSELAQEVVEGRTYWFATTMPEGKDLSSMVALLPSYDEYIVGYKDRSAVYDPKYNAQITLGNVVFNPSIVIGGQVVGTWKRNLKRNSVLLETNFLTPLPEENTDAFHQAMHRYGAFLRQPIEQVRSGGEIQAEK